MIRRSKRRTFWSAIRSVLRTIDRAIPIDDSWQKREAMVAKHRFGHGNQHNWQWYFNGRSGVYVSSLKHVCRWLRRCKYTHDATLFQERDFWQHPVTFETTQKGDCEDHAVWAWRKLIELGIPAELVYGKCTYVHPDDSAHVWVVFMRKERSYVLETTAKARKRMVLPVHKAKHYYSPEVSVDANLKTYVYD